MIPIRDSVRCSHRPIIVLSLIVANGLVFLWEWSLPPASLKALVAGYALIPLRYSDPQWAASVGLDSGDYLPFLTNTFMHGGWLHVILNMWVLWIFGCALEDRLGPGRFLAFYLLAGLAASATHFYFNAASPVPALGASGAIAGVISAYTVLFPRARVTLLLPILFFPFFFDVPALLFAAFWFLLQLLQGAAALFQPGIAGGIAWWAHIGGFVAGIVLLGAFGLTQRSGLRPWDRR